MSTRIEENISLSIQKIKAPPPSKELSEEDEKFLELLDNPETTPELLEAFIRDSIVRRGKNEDQHTETPYEELFSRHIIDETTCENEDLAQFEQALPHPKLREYVSTNKPPNWESVQVHCDLPGNEELRNEYFHYRIESGLMNLRPGTLIWPIREKVDEYFTIGFSSAGEGGWTLLHCLVHLCDPINSISVSRKLIIQDIIRLILDCGINIKQQDDRGLMAVDLTDDTQIIALFNDKGVYKNPDRVVGSEDIPEGFRYRNKLFPGGAPPPGTPLPTIGLNGQQKIKDFFKGIFPAASRSSVGQTVNKIVEGQADACDFVINSHQVYHVSSGVVGTNNTATLFFTVNQATGYRTIIAAGEHVEWTKYRIIWKKPGYEQHFGNYFEY